MKLTDAAQAYTRFRDDIVPVLDQRRYPAWWLDGQVFGQHVELWWTKRAIIIAELREYPSGAKDVHGLVAAGDLEDIVSVLIPRAEEWGRSMGCIGAVIESRPAWGRALAGSGYAPYQLAVRKGL